jgi:hypothetical protein
VKFTRGMVVEYRTTKGWVDFIGDQYITICYIDIPDPSCRHGRYQSTLCVFREYWNEVCSCVDEEQEEGTSEARSDLL